MVAQVIHLLYTGPLCGVYLKLSFMIAMVYSIKFNSVFFVQRQMIN